MMEAKSVKLIEFNFWIF